MSTPIQPITGKVIISNVYFYLADKLKQTILEYLHYIMHIVINVYSTSVSNGNLIYKV